MNGHDDQGSVYLLLSGGVDSTACAAHYVAAGRDVIGIFVNYGQAAASAEEGAAERIAAHYGFPLRRVALSGGVEFGAGMITGRNGALLFAALMCSGAARGTIAIGVHAATAYYDCSKDFIERMRQVIAACSEDGFVLEAPFVDRFKFEVYDYARGNDVPLHLTYSCETGSTPPCGKCFSCVDVSIEQMRMEGKFG
jgi:7-cyano-7-deazaguanine synthase